MPRIVSPIDEHALSLERRVQQPQPGVQAPPQRVAHAAHHGGVAGLHQRLHELDEHVAQVVLPEGVDGGGGGREVIPEGVFSS